MYAEPGKFYLGNVGRVPVFVAVEAILLLLFVYMITPPAVVGFDGYLISLFALVLTILLHEVGHATLAIVTGMQGVRITIGAMGGYCTYSGDRHPKRALPITLAGVTVNLLLWWLMVIIKPHVAALGIDALTLFVSIFGIWNMVLGIFNALPIYPLDGGQAVLLVSQLWAKNEASARRFTLSVTVAAAIAVLVFLSQWGGLSTWNLIIIGLLLMQAFRELR